MSSSLCHGTFISSLVACGGFVNSNTLDILKAQQGVIATADCKRGQWKGATSKIAKSCQDKFRQLSRRARNVKYRQKVSRAF